ncbi:hypothetical protein DRJ17_03915 [Candidatus Woesearchaeota archaeon]|nr:MAG: hypothetical protein DRJ17_03915 [Candidatus Woesearchaeota archaeon]
MALKYKTTRDIKIPKNIIDQVIGQDDAVAVIKKAAKQRRHVLLIGEPGTGKSMLGLGLAELLPKEKLVDVLSFFNPNDENQPLIRTVEAGKGRNLVAKSKLHATGVFRGYNFLLFILVIIAMIAPWWGFNHYSNIPGGNLQIGAIMFVALFMGGMIFLAAFILFLNLGRKAGIKTNAPKLIVDNFDKKKVPFYDATGAHAGALLGDVLHDPFQCFFRSQMITKLTGGKLMNVEINKEINDLFNNSKNLEKKDGYEAVFLNKNDLVVLGESQGSVSPVDVLSANRHDYEGEMIKLMTSENKELIVTPKHKIALWKNGKIVYTEARDIKNGDTVVSKAEDIIIDEDDIINTFNRKQQKQCKLYYQNLDSQQKNKTSKHKRIEVSIDQKIRKARWWHTRNTPDPVQMINWLKKRKLLPLKIDNIKLHLIARVLGAMFSNNGGVTENLNEIFLSGSDKGAIVNFKKDIETIFNLNKDEKSQIIEDKNHKNHEHSWYYQNTNKSMIRFFLALGLPISNKKNTVLNVPQWIKSKGELEDEFYGSFLGRELSSSHNIDKNESVELKVEIPSENRKMFLYQLANYLQRKGIESNTTYIKNIKRVSEKRLSEDLVCRLRISTKFDNVIKFLMKITLSYCDYKTERLFLALRKQAKDKKKKYYSLINQGYGAENVMRLLKLTPNSLYLLLNYLEEKSEGATT